MTIATVNDPGTRERLSAPAIRAFFRLAKQWDLPESHQLALLGASISRATLHTWRTRSPKSPLSIDQLQRISYVLAIYEGLQRVFRRAPEEGDRWLRRPRVELPFAGATPLDVMVEHGITGLDAVRRYVDGAAGGPPSRELSLNDATRVARAG